MEDLNKKKTLFVIFSKESDNIIGSFESEAMVEKVNKELFNVKKIELGPNDYYFGSYKDGKTYDKLERPLVNERDIIDRAYQDIIKEWPLLAQIKVILDVIEKNDKIEKTQDFKNLVNFIKQTMHCLKVKIDAIKNNKVFNFISSQDLQKAYEKDNPES